MTHDIPAAIPVPEYMHELIQEVTALRKAQAPFEHTHEMTLAVALNIGLQRYRETLLIIKQENEPELSALLREQAA